MTSLSGIRVLNEGKDRLFAPLHKLVLIADGLGIAIMAVQSGGHFEFTGVPCTTALCGSFPVAVKFPLLMPTIAMAEGRPMTEIAFSFEPKTPQIVPPGKKANIVQDYGNSVLHALTPIYVDFFEKHRRWLKAKYPGSNANVDWPPLFNFARMIRNFISHHAGHVHFPSQNSPGVTWHHLNYSPADDGKQVLGADIHIGDLIVLFVEIGDELDRLGCPFDP